MAYLFCWRGSGNRKNVCGRKSGESRMRKKKTCADKADGAERVHSRQLHGTDCRFLLQLLAAIHSLTASAFTLWNFSFSDGLVNLLQNWLGGNSQAKYSSFFTGNFDEICIFFFASSGTFHTLMHILHCDMGFLKFRNVF